MGYETQYTIKADIDKCTICDMKDLTEIVNRLAAISGYDNWDVLVTNEEGRIESGNSIKWYEHDKDMGTLSREFPGTTFEVHGVGEGINEEWDEWKKWYKDGKIIKMERIVVTADWEEVDVKKYQKELDMARQTIEEFKKKMREGIK